MTDAAFARSATFLAHCPRAAEDEVDAEAVEAALDTMLKTAHAAWPTVSVADDVFLKYVAERVDEGSDVLASLRGMCVEDLYLACGCFLDQTPAIQAFDRHMLGAITEPVRRIGHSTEFVEEVQQITRFKLLVSEKDVPKKIGSFRGRGKLRSWVQVTAVRTALELKRRAKPEDARGDDELFESDDLDNDPELQHIRVLYRAEFAAAFKEALRELSSRERNILRMNVLDGLNIDQIGAVYRVHRATVARWIAKARETLLAETRRKLIEKLLISETEFESLMHVVRSHLELSIERFLIGSKGGS